jgi:type IV secretory pathway component VirB8
LDSVLLIIIASIFFTCYIMFTYIIAFVLPLKVEEILIKQYPEYKLV